MLRHTTGLVRTSRGEAGQRDAFFDLDLEYGQPALAPLHEQEDGYKLFCHHFSGPPAAESAFLLLAWFR